MILLGYKYLATELYSLIKTPKANVAYNSEKHRIPSVNNQNNNYPSYLNGAFKRNIWSFKMGKLCKG